MPHPCEFHVDASLSELRALQRPFGPVDSDVRLVPEIYFSWDTDKGAVAVQAGAAPDGGLMRMEARVSRTPRWLSLNVGLGPGRFEPGEVLGIVADFRDAAGLQPIRPILRSMQGDDKQDTVCSAPLTPGAEPGAQTMLHEIQPQDPITWMNDYHTLILPLPAVDFAVTLASLRILLADPMPGLAPPELIPYQIS